MAMWLHAGHQGGAVPLCRDGGDVIFLNWMPREGFTEKVGLSKSLSEEAGYASIWEKRVPGRRNSRMQGPEAGWGYTPVEREEATVTRVESGVGGQASTRHAATGA